MVHNGIEYGDMQLICEAYHLMKVSRSKIVISSKTYLHIPNRTLLVWEMTR